VRVSRPDGAAGFTFAVCSSSVSGDRGGMGVEISSAFASSNLRNTSLFAFLALR
jgi:hypothetical protein